MLVVAATAPSAAVMAMVAWGLRPDAIGACAFIAAVGAAAAVVAAEELR